MSQAGPLACHVTYHIVSSVPDSARQEDSLSGPGLDRGRDVRGVELRSWRGGGGAAQR